MKKRPAKKTAPTPRGKYKPRAPKGTAGDAAGKASNGDVVKLLQLEVVDIESLGRSRRIDAEIVKMEELLKKMKPKEGFIIKNSWVKHIYKIVNDSKLKILVRTFRIAGNDRVRRVVRLT